jgi:hypothetical protein
MDGTSGMASASQIKVRFYDIRALREPCVHCKTCYCLISVLVESYLYHLSPSGRTQDAVRQSVQRARQTKFCQDASARPRSLIIIAAPGGLGVPLPGHALDPTAGTTCSDMEDAGVDTGHAACSRDVLAIVPTVVD